VTALGEAFTDLHRRRQDDAYTRGYAAGWYAAQLEQAREQQASQPAAFPLKIKEAERG
jgi:hypothetical protein